jgi:ferredoxin-nitrite reductase/sulfite reductase (ferredoxin)
MAIDRLLQIYKANRENCEVLSTFLDRFGSDRVAEILAEFTQLPAYEEAPDGFQDWGEEELFQVKTGVGECAV